MGSMLSPTTRVRRSIFICVICFVALVAALKSLPASSEVSQNAKKFKPVQVPSNKFAWRVDLHPLGYPADDPMLQRRRDLHDFDTLDFLSETVEVATFLTQEPAHDLRTRDVSTPAPYTLHAIFLNTASGKILNTLEWPVPDSNAGIFSRYDGSFLFFSTERIVRYSADWQPMKELPLPQLQELHVSLLDISESPSGNVVVIRYRHDQSPFCIRISTETLEGAQQPCAVPISFAISDQWMAAAPGDEQGKEIDSGPQFHPLTQIPTPSLHAFSIMIRANSGESLRLLCETRDASADGCAVAQFISDEWIVLLGGRTVVLTNPEGHVAFKESFDINDVFLDPAGKIECVLHHTEEGSHWR